MDKPLTKFINNQLDIKLGHLTQEKFDVVLTKIKNWKAAGLDEIPPEEWKTRKFDDMLLRYCNAFYNQNTKERCTKSYILPFFQERWQQNCQELKGIILIPIVVKIYNALLLNRIEPEMEKILWKNKNGFRRKRSTTSQILTIHRILSVCSKKLYVTHLLVDFSKAFDSIYRRKIEKIFEPKSLWESVTGIIMLYKNTKIKVHSLDGGIDFVDIVTGVLQGDTLAPYLVIICKD